MILSNYVENLHEVPIHNSILQYSIYVFCLEF